MIACCTSLRDMISVYVNGDGQPACVVVVRDYGVNCLWRTQYSRRRILPAASRRIANRRAGSV